MTKGRGGSGWNLYDDIKTFQILWFCLIKTFFPLYTPFVLESMWSTLCFIQSGGNAAAKRDRISSRKFVLKWWWCNNISNWPRKKGENNCLCVKKPWPGLGQTMYPGRIIRNSKNHLIWRIIGELEIIFLSKPCLRRCFSFSSPFFRWLRQ